MKRYNIIRFVASTQTPPLPPNDIAPAGDTTRGQPPRCYNLRIYFAQVSDRQKHHRQKWGSDSRSVNGIQHAGGEMCGSSHILLWTTGKGGCAAKTEIIVPQLHPAQLNGRCIPMSNRMCNGEQHVRDRVRGVDRRRVEVKGKGDRIPSPSTPMWCKVREWSGVVTNFHTRGRIIWGRCAPLCFSRSETRRKRCREGLC